MPACFLRSNHELRPAQVTGNSKYLHGNHLTFHWSRLSWVRSHSKTINKALHTPFTAIIHRKLLCLIAIASRYDHEHEVYACFHVLALCHSGLLWENPPFPANWKFWGSTWKSDAGTGKYKLLPAKTYWKLLRKGKIIFQAIFRSSQKKTGSNLPVSTSTTTHLEFLPRKNKHHNVSTQTKIRRCVFKSRRGKKKKPHSFNYF